MIFDSDKLGREQTYKLMTGLIVPRPIAWVGTLNAEGAVNLAPFSAFTFLSTDPPIIGISVTLRRGGLKDTAANIQARGCFVVNIADEGLVGPLHASSAEFPPETGEAEMLGLETVPSVDIEVPRLACVPAAMECRLERVVEFGDAGARLIAGRITAFHIRDDLVVEGKIATDRLRPLSRLAGPRYAGIGTPIEMQPLHEGGRIYAGGQQADLPIQRKGNL